MFLSAACIALLAACVPFFDTTPSGTVTDDVGTDTPDVEPDTPPNVFPTEDGRQCGEFEIRTSPQAGSVCGDTMECAQGFCLVVDGRGATCSSRCSPVHCPQICGEGRVCGASPETFSDGTPIGYCMPETADYGLCTADEQCNEGSSCFSVIDIGIVPFGWCIPACEATCERFGDAEPYCTALSEEPRAPRGCVVACDPNADLGRCPAGLGCIDFGDGIGICAEYPLWLRALFRDFGGG